MTGHVPRATFATAFALAVGVALGLALLLGAALAQDVQLEQRVFEIARQLRCPVCVSESVADSNASVSIEMRQVIQEQLESGRSEQQILAYFQNSYGDWILLEPPKRGIHLLVWLLPGIAAVIGVAALALFVRRWLRAGRETSDVPQEDLERVRKALEEQPGGSPP